MEDSNITASAVSKDDEARKVGSKGDGQIFEQNVIKLCHFSETSADEDSCESTICLKTIETEEERLNDYETGTFLQSSTQETGSEFITLEELEESGEKKEQHNSLSSTGSNGSISGSVQTTKFDSSLNALKYKKNQLIDSLKSVLADSSGVSLDTSVIEEGGESADQMNTSVSTVVSDFGNSEYRSNIGTSTPFPESKPLAARFLRKWKPSFISEEVCEIDETDTSDDPYEKAMAGLKQVLNDTSADTASKLDSYSNMLDIFKSENDKKYDQMISTIASENDNLEECLENPTKEVDEFIEKFIGLEPPILTTGSTTVLDSKESTIVAREKTITLSDTENTITDVLKSPAIVTIDSSQTENDETLVESKKSEISPTPVESIEDDIPNDEKPSENDEHLVESKISETALTSPAPVESVKSDVPDNQLPTEFVPKENDLEVLIIGGDEDIDINVDDEDLLLASDDEGKHDKSEKKSHPQIPLVKDLEVFISNDPDENKDNNDPKWDYLRNLGTDYDRYLAVRARWKNIQIPNPKRDLTCRCRNPVEQLPTPPTFNKNNNNIDYQNHNNNRTSKKRLRSPENQYKFSKRARKESCTILFDRNIDQLAEDVKIERQCIMNEQEQTLQQLADIQHMEKYVTKQKGGTMMDMKRLENKHIIDTRKCVEDFRIRLEKLIEMARAKLTALQRASEEVRQFHEFYPNEDEKHGDTKSLVYLTDTEVQEILEVEEMLLSFPSFYNE